MDPLDEVRRRLEQGEELEVLADELNITQKALDQRLVRHFGETAKTIRTGVLQQKGRPPTDRTVWFVRLTAEERAVVDAALAMAAAGEGATAGANLVAALFASGKRLKVNLSLGLGAKVAKKRRPKI